MAAMAGALTYATTALSVAQAVHTYQVGKVNVKAEKKMGELRAEERRDKLRRTLASQRVALTQSGGDPDTGTALVLYAEARKAAERESMIDNFQTSTTVKNIKGKSIGDTLTVIGKTGTSLLSTYDTSKQKKVA